MNIKSNKDFNTSVSFLKELTLCCFFPWGRRGCDPAWFNPCRYLKPLVDNFSIKSFFFRSMYYINLEITVLSKCFKLQAGCVCAFSVCGCVFVCLCVCVFSVFCDSSVLQECMVRSSWDLTFKVQYPIRHLEIMFCGLF